MKLYMKLYIKLYFKVYKVSYRKKKIIFVRPHRRCDTVQRHAYNVYVNIANSIDRTKGSRDRVLLFALKLAIQSSQY